MIWLTDVQNKGRVAINPDHVVVVFTAPDGDYEGKTIISMVNGTLMVEEDDLEVVTAVQGAKSA